MPPDSHRYRKMYLVDSVFPAPDSPDTTMDWDCLSIFISLRALSTKECKFQQIIEKLTEILKALINYQLQKHGEAIAQGISLDISLSHPCCIDSSIHSMGLQQ